MAMLQQQWAPVVIGSRPLPQVTRAGPPRRSRVCCRATTETVVAQQESAFQPQPSRAVSAQIEKTSWTSRRLYASVNVQAPTQVVWECLTDYAGLGEFIPSLTENECLERKPNGAVLRQVGAQEVAMGVNFKALCILDCTEYPQGVPMELCSVSGNGKDGGLPYPHHSQQGAPSMDIAFRMVEGDFKDFRGVWRMQPDLAAQGSNRAGTLLCYSLFVQPKPWLPVGLIQSRIQKEISKNLQAVRQRAEQVHRGSVSGSDRATSYSPTGSDSDTANNMSTM